MPEQTVDEILASFDNPKPKKARVQQLASALHVPDAAAEDDSYFSTKNLRKYGAIGVRGLGAYLAAPGEFIGAAAGGGSEAIAQLVEGSRGPMDPKYWGHVGAESLIGAVPLGKIFEGGKIARSLVRGAGMGAVSPVIRHGMGENDWNPANYAGEIGVGGALGGAVGGGLAALLGVAKPGAKVAEDVLTKEFPEGMQSTWPNANTKPSVVRAIDRKRSAMKLMEIRKEDQLNKLRGLGGVLKPKSAGVAVDVEGALDLAGGATSRGAATADRELGKTRWPVPQDVPLSLEDTQAYGARAKSAAQTEKAATQADATAAKAAAKLKLKYPNLGGMLRGKPGAAAESAVEEELGTLATTKGPNYVGLTEPKPLPDMELDAYGARAVDAARSDKVALQAEGAAAKTADKEKALLDEARAGHREGDEKLLDTTHKQLAGKDPKELAPLEAKILDKLAPRAAEQQGKKLSAVARLLGIFGDDAGAGGARAAAAPAAETAAETLAINTPERIAARALKPTFSAAEVAASKTAAPAVEATAETVASSDPNKLHIPVNKTAQITDAIPTQAEHAKAHIEEVAREFRQAQHDMRVAESTGVGDFDALKAESKRLGQQLSSLKRQNAGGLPFAHNPENGHPQLFLRGGTHPPVTYAGQGIDGHKFNVEIGGKQFTYGADTIRSMGLTVPEITQGATSGAAAAKAAAEANQARLAAEAEAEAGPVSSTTGKPLKGSQLRKFLLKKETGGAPPPAANAVVKAPAVPSSAGAGAEDYAGTLSSEELARSLATQDDMQNFLGKSGSATTARGGGGAFSKGSDRGAAELNLMAHLASAGLGAGVGYATDPFGDKTESTLAGGAVGLGSAAGVAKLMKLDPARMKEILDAIPQYQRSVMLANPSGLAANTVISTIGSSFWSGIEKALQGDPRGLRTLKELFATRGQHLQQARIEALLEAGRGEGVPLSKAASKAQHVMGLPGYAMDIADRLTRGIAERAGFAEEEARKINFTSRPAWPISQATVDYVRKGGRWLQSAFPFARTPVNIFEQGMERLPFIGALVQGARGDSLRQIAVQQVMGGGLMYGSEQAGEHMTPEQSRFARKFMSNSAGQYSLPVSLGLAVGQAKRAKNDSLKALLRETAQSFPVADPTDLIDPKGIAGRIVPSGMRDIAEFLDKKNPKASWWDRTNNERPVPTTDSFLDQLRQQLELRTPGLRTNVPLKSARARRPVRGPRTRE